MLQLLKNMFQRNRNPIYNMNSDRKKQKKPQLPLNIKWLILIPLVLIALILVGMRCTFNLTNNQMAVVTVLGRPYSVNTPGIKFRVPFISNHEILSTSIEGMPIGYDQATDASIEEESLMITGDFNIINVDFFLEYYIADPITYVYASKEPIINLKMLAQSYMRDTVGKYEVDDVLTDKRAEIEAKVKEELGERLIQEDWGVSLHNITIQDVETPTPEIKAAFDAVEEARQTKEELITKGNQYKNEKMAEVSATVDKLEKDAASQKEARVNEATGQADRFDALYEEYKKYPLITKQRMFYEAMEEVLPDLKVIIDGSDGTTQKHLPLEPFTETENTGDSPAPTEPDQTTEGEVDES